MSRITVEITYRDDTKKRFGCKDFPNVGDPVVLFLDNKQEERLFIPREKVSEMRYWFTK